jgi:hypothetical protein
MKRVRQELIRNDISNKAIYLTTHNRIGHGVEGLPSPMNKSKYNYDTHE